MDYEFNEEKSRETLRDRGIGFDFAARIFEGRRIEKEDRRKDYGERRFIAIGPIDDAIYVVVYTWRDGRRRIISARRANRKELGEWQAVTVRRDGAMTGLGPRDRPCTVGVQ